MLLYLSVSQGANAGSEGAHAGVSILFNILTPRVPVLWIQETTTVATLYVVVVGTQQLTSSSLSSAIDHAFLRSPRCQLSA